MCDIIHTLGSSPLIEEVVLDFRFWKSASFLSTFIASKDLKVAVLPNTCKAYVSDAALQTALFASRLEAVRGANLHVKLLMGLYNADSLTELIRQKTKVLSLFLVVPFEQLYVINIQDLVQQLDMLCEFRISGMLKLWDSDSISDDSFVLLDIFRALWEHPSLEKTSIQGRVLTRAKRQIDWQKRTQDKLKKFDSNPRSRFFSINFYLTVYDVEEFHYMLWQEQNRLVMKLD